MIWFFIPYTLLSRSFLRFYLLTWTTLRRERTFEQAYWNLPFGFRKTIIVKYEWTCYRIPNSYLASKNDVTQFLTPSLIIATLLRLLSQNPLPTKKVTSFMDDPFSHWIFTKKLNEWGKVFKQMYKFFVPVHSLRFYSCSFRF